MHLDFAHRLDDAFGDQVAAHDAAENIHQDRAHVVVRQDQLEGLGDFFRGCAAADVEEIGRFTAVQLDQVHGRHGQSGAVDHAGDVAVERDVIETVFVRAAFFDLFLIRVTQLGEQLLTVERVVVQVDLAVQRQHATVSVTTSGLISIRLRSLS